MFCVPTKCPFLPAVPAASKQPSPRADVLRYVDDPDFTYQDFANAKRPASTPNTTGGGGNTIGASTAATTNGAAVSDIPTFRIQDYSWEEQGFTLANRLYSDIGKLLDDKFAIAKDLTYYT
jgi:sestrin